MIEFNAIPAMDDPLGKHWQQPKDIRLAPMDDSTIVLTSEQYRNLLTYDTTMPTGVYPGKCWRRRESRERILLVWYGIVENDSGMCSIEYRNIEVLK